MILTEEQIKITDSINSPDENIVINAYAGSGKTTTLIELTKAILEKETEAKVLYVVFNSSMADEARFKFQQNWLDVECRTAHSFALSQFRKKQQINVAGFIDYSIYEQIKPQEFCSFIKVNKLLENYCLSYQKIKSFVETEKEKASLGLRSKDNFSMVEIETFERLYYYLIENYTYTHGLYLKEYAMNTDIINGYDYLLFDEAQDADPWMLEIARKINCKKRYFVGDTHQSIYGWRGAINAMEKVENAAIYNLSSSFRFGNEIAGIANEILSYKPSFKGLISGSGVCPTSEDSPTTVLFRTNASMIEYGLKKLDENSKTKLTFQGFANNKQSNEFTEIYHDFLSLIKAIAEEEGKKELLAGLNQNFYFAKLSTKITKMQNIAKKERSSLRSYLHAQARNNCIFDNEISRYFNFFTNNEYKIIEKLIQLRDSGTIEDPEVSYNLITAHRAKGLEWDSVLISDDDWSTDTVEELNLLYVAVTRSKGKIIIESNVVKELLENKQQKLAV